MPAAPRSDSAHNALENDRTLISRVVASDDREAFRILVERHQGAIRSVLRRLTRGDQALADDLAQSAILRAYMTLDTFEGKAELRTWLYRIACNEFFQHRRSRRGKETVNIDEIESSTFGASSAPDVSAHAAMSIDLERAMKVLSDAEREAIVLCYYAELSHQEAADLLACPLGTLKSNLSRGKVKLHQALKAWAPQKPEALQ
jgi:RNA polymerase sigma-70 factor (ECF subfamily)